METKLALAALAALSQSTRLAIFRLLVSTGPEGLNAGSLAQQLQLAPATLSFHLKELHHAGIVSSRRDGRAIYYAADYGAMNGLIAYLTENCCQGEPCAPQPTAGLKPGRSATARKGKRHRT